MSNYQQPHTAVDTKHSDKINSSTATRSSELLY